jgi:hypothetical protein
MRSDDEIVAVHVDVANRGDRKIALERLPVITVVE